MRPLAAMDASSRASVRGLLTDIDDTVSTEGRITAQAFAAMEHYHRSGHLLIPITGRPAGWCDHIARMWPVDAVVGENGALYMRYDAASRRMHKVYIVDEATRRMQRERLATIGARILREVPGCALASDQGYRESDLAIDFCEDVAPLSPAAIDEIVAIMRSEGLTAKVSSIHVNGWFGSYDKLTMTRRLLRDEFDIDLDRERDQFIFVGDSPNDAPMFDYFPLSVGVANVRAARARIATPPKYVTTHPAGAGFAEVVEHLLGRG